MNQEQSKNIDATPPMVGSGVGEGGLLSDERLDGIKERHHDAMEHYMQEPVMVTSQYINDVAALLSHIATLRHRLGEAEERARAAEVKYGVMLARTNIGLELATENQATIAALRARLGEAEAAGAAKELVGESAALFADVRRKIQPGIAMQSARWYRVAEVLDHAEAALLLAEDRAQLPLMMKGQLDRAKERAAQAEAALQKEQQHAETYAKECGRLRQQVDALSAKLATKGEQEAQLLKRDEELRGLRAMNKALEMVRAAHMEKQQQAIALLMSFPEYEEAARLVEHMAPARLPVEEAGQFPGMPEAKCHGCGLKSHAVRCQSADCPGKKAFGISDAAAPIQGEEAGKEVGNG